MNNAQSAAYSGWSRLKLFLALSRTPHALLDLTTPAVAAILCLGRLPPVSVVTLGMLTAFAGYTAVYALNDLVDYRVDKAKIAERGVPSPSVDLDAVYVRHPLAQGLLSLREGVLWTAGWAVVALSGAYALNPVCVFIFLGGCLAEAVYCLLLRVTWRRTLVSGAVKAAGGLAAVFAVEPNPPIGFVITLFAWLFTWEIGGQNIPNDLADLEEDRALGAETVPVRFGMEKAGRFVLYTLGAATFFSFLLYAATPARLGPMYLPGAAGAAGVLLLWPAFSTYRTRSTDTARVLFNRSSTYPLTMLILVLLSINR